MRIDRYIIVFVLLALISMQAAIFADEYGKSLSAHYIESQRSIELFQQDADKYFNGDMQALISLYRRNNDPALKGGGSNIEIMYSRFRILKNAVESLQGGRFSQMWQIVFHPINDIRSEVFNRSTLAFRIENSILFFSIVCGLFGAAAIEVCCSIISLTDLGVLPS